ncbi:hypothetical protein BDV27DRAFT_156897 [Aspergillus caelatus]|uniref:Uncharacterized protein n=1 Tax=Aspergillus caelatus TaxID=61420 RepID=A0A5N7A869_9EURO|nr:uncharacterized protein BDV27DRAFT_156897 [Aspergillus caelatus]KAE8365406.1 hypothetical protein BDV27DRAFT_156897 [Aspergillus caelatus]
MTNHIVDGISVSYFQGIYRCLPIISRKRFHDYLIHVGTSPPASFSVLLPNICLVMCHPEILPQTPQHISRVSLYITVKLLFTQAVFFCELSTRDQPFTTDIFGHFQLTISEDIDQDDSMSRFQAAVESIEMKGLGYSAQAAWLLDQVLKATKHPNASTQLNQLDELGPLLQALLGSLLEQY